MPVRLEGNLPRDLFKLALYGTPDELGDNNFNLTKLALKQPFT